TPGYDVAYVTVTLASISWVPGSTGVPGALADPVCRSSGTGVAPLSETAVTRPSVRPGAAASACALARASATAAPSASRYAADWSAARRFGPDTWLAPAPTAASI